MSDEARDETGECEAVVPPQFSLAAMLVVVGALSALFALYRGFGQSGLLYWGILCFALHSLWRRTLFVLVWGGLLGVCLAGEYYDHYRRTSLPLYDPSELKLHIWVLPGALLGMIVGMAFRAIVTAVGHRTVARNEDGPGPSSL